MTTLSAVRGSIVAGALALAADQASAEVLMHHHSTVSSLDEENAAMVLDQTDSPQQWVVRLTQAINRHDLDALASCFAAEYVSEAPTHPARSFKGGEQVRKNWQQILSALPDLAATPLRQVIHGNSAWVEWEWSGTRADGARQLMRGVTITGVEAGVATWARFYMEPVEGTDGLGINATIAGRYARPAEGGA